MLTDFGLARAVDDATLTRTGIIAGTPQYMSPEQAKGQPVDRRADIRVDTTLVLIPVAVTDPMSRFVTGLDKENFKLNEKLSNYKVVNFLR